MSTNTSSFKKEIFNKLRRDIFLSESYKSTSISNQSFGLGAIETAFPNSVFPLGSIHEFLNTEPEYAAAANGFIAGLLHTIMKNEGVCLWISTSRTLFPPSLKMFGIEPDKFIFIDLKKQKDLLWATEEALKCNGLAAVVAEVQEISLTQSRRLQLATEKSGVTGIILRNDPCKMVTNACAARWQIKPISSELEKDMPGVGFPRWNVELLKVRNGQPGNWEIEWAVDHFHVIENLAKDFTDDNRVQILQTGS